MKRAIHSKSRSKQIQTNLGTIRLYAELLAQMGDHQRAIAVLNEGKAFAPTDINIARSLLDLESSPGVILSERRKIYRQNPNDRENAAKLVQFLASTVPSRDTLLNADGEERFSFSDWNRVPAADQARLLATERAAWATESDAIMEAMMPEEDRDLGWHRFRAAQLKARGDVAEGEQLLRDYAANLTVGSVDWVTAMLSSSYYLADSKQYDKAFGVLDEAVSHQGSRDASR